MISENIVELDINIDRIISNISHIFETNINKTDKKKNATLTISSSE
jgi:hypothetical protein